MRRVAAVSAVLAFVALTPPAYAGEPTDHVDPNKQGSLVDVANATSAVRSDTGLDGDGPPLVGDVNVNGCSAVMVKPAAEANPTSPTGVDVMTRFSFQCLLQSPGTATFAIEYRTIDGWQPLVRKSVTVAAEGGIQGQPLSGACRAGTWYYRGRATGTVDFVTASTVLTCLRVSDPAYIEP